MICREYRESANLSMTQVAEGMGRSTTTIWRFEHSEQTPRDLEPFVRHYAEIVGVDPDAIWAEALGFVPPDPTEALQPIRRTITTGIVVTTGSLLILLAGALIGGLIHGAFVLAAIVVMAAFWVIAVQRHL
jgi:transcriptional regulator with XRE-family HTH domain